MSRDFSAPAGARVPQCALIAGRALRRREGVTNVGPRENGAVELSALQLPVGMSERAKRLLIDTLSAGGIEEQGVSKVFGFRTELAG
jgi:hypothetical protein